MPDTPDQSRRAILKTIGAATLTTTAGCLTRNNNGDGDVTDQDNELDRNTELTESTVTNNIDEFDISNTTMSEDAFTFTVTNTGDTPDELTRYEFKTELFDVNSDVQATGYASPAHDPVEPGNSKDITIHMTIDPDEIARYELTISCTDRNGAYCD